MPDEMTIYIDSVDGETCYSKKLQSGKDGLEFLERYNHEGSSIVLKLSLDDPEKIYDFLRLLSEKK